MWTNECQILYTIHRLSLNLYYLKKILIDTVKVLKIKLCFILLGVECKNYSNILILKQMVLLLLGDSQVERVWPTVRLDREVLRTAIYFPVKNRASILSGYSSITASVII